MIGFKLDPITNDITATGGKISLLSTVQEAVRQRLSVKFKTFQNEWFLDTTYGMPYRQQIIGKGLSQREIDALYIAEVNEDPDVQRIVYFVSEYNPYTRLYDLDFEVRVADQPLRVTTVNSTPNEEIEYPEPDNSALEPSCDFFVEGQVICELHHIVHCDLPECGEYTWIANTNTGLYVNKNYVISGYVIEFKEPCGDSQYVIKGYVNTGYVTQFNDPYLEIEYCSVDYVDNYNEVSGFDCVKYYGYDYAEYDYVGFSCDQFEIL